jgi:hypothetical protein
MITTDRIIRLITNNKTRYFSLKKEKILTTPHGITFSIFFQLLCQDLNLYSTKALQNRRLDKETRREERNKLMAVHEELDNAIAILEKHKETICLKEEYCSNEKNKFSIYKKHIRFFVEKILLPRLLIIQMKGGYSWQKIDNKDGIWRECDKNKLVPLEAESYIDPTTQKSYIKFSPIPNI